MRGLWFRHVLLPQGWTASARFTLVHDRIGSVEIGVAPEPGDERHEIGLPGLSNLHSHAFQRAMAGRAELGAKSGDDFWLWRSRMYELAAAIEPEDLRAIAALAFAEMLQAGFVRVGEFHYLHNARNGHAYDNPGEMAVSIAAAAAETGVALTLLPVFYAHSGFGGAALTQAQARFRNDIESYAAVFDASLKAIKALPGSVIGVAPHSLRAVTPEELDEVVRLAQDRPIHIHIAEQLQEVADCRAWSGQTPVAWLLSHAPVDQRWCLVHATHVDANELAALSASNAVVGLCPVTEANLGDGVFAAREFVAAGGRYGVGTDSNVLIDLAQELRLLEYGQRLTRQQRNVLGRAGEPTADRLFRDVLAGGARALGSEAVDLLPGNPATLVTLTPDHPALADAPAEEFLSRWVFAAAGGAVDSVWVNGRKCVERGRHIQWDRIVDDYRRATARLRRTLAA